jgi:hypothetical protein
MKDTKVSKEEVIDSLIEYNFTIVNAEYNVGTDNRQMPRDSFLHHLQ